VNKLTNIFSSKSLIRSTICHRSKVAKPILISDEVQYRLIW
jgi:hypothetical protein